MLPRRLVSLCLLLAALSLCGCSSNNKGKIEGTTWISQAANLKGQMIPAGIGSLDFATSGKLTFQLGPQNHTGTYSLGSSDYVTLNFDQDFNGRKSHVQRIKINGNVLTMIDSDGTEMSFTKK